MAQTEVQEEEMEVWRVGKRDGDTRRWMKTERKTLPLPPQLVIIFLITNTAFVSTVPPSSHARSFIHNYGRF